MADKLKFTLALLLFVACDGWSVLCQGLLTGYSVAAQAGILP